MKILWDLTESGVVDPSGGISLLHMDAADLTTFNFDSHPDMDVVVCCWDLVLKRDVFRHVVDVANTSSQVKGERICNKAYHQYVCCMRVCLVFLFRDHMRN